MASNTIGILNSALQTNKKKMDIAMQNIANADNEMYSAKVLETNSVVIDNTPCGVQSNAILNKTNAFLQKNVFTSGSVVAATDYVSNECKKIVNKLALPETGQSICSLISDFQQNIINLSCDANSTALRTSLKESAMLLTKGINDIAYSIQDQRFNADQNLSQSLQTVNATLNELRQLNSLRIITKEGTMSYAQLSDQMNAGLATLSKYFDISYNTDSIGLMHVYIKNNGQEILGQQVYSFEYTPLKSVDDFLNNKQLNSIYLVAKSVNDMQETKAAIVEGGSDLSYNFGAGLIAGLLEVRDVICPQVAETIDQLALGISKEINSIHNLGNGSMPLNSLTGTTLITGKEKIIGNGTVIINPMTSTGKPCVTSNGNKIPAMKLNLSTFTNNGIPGSFDTNGLINEINYYFESFSTGKRLSMNGLYSTNLAVTNVEYSTPNHINNLTLDLDCLGLNNNTKVTIGNISAINNANNAIDVSILNSSNFTINHGEQLRTANEGPKIQLNNISDYPVTIAIDITTVVNDQLECITVTYKIDPLNLNAENIINKRFTPNELISASQSAKLTNNGSTSSIIKASLVNNNQAVTQDDFGYLKIENTLRDGVVAINNLTDTQIVSTTNSNLHGGFSNAFGLNDMFVFKKEGKNIADIQNTPNYAAFLQLNDAIVKSPTAISIGTMSIYNGGEDSYSDIFYAAGVGSTSLINQYQNLSTKNILFGNTKDISNNNNTIYGYAASIIDVNNVRAIEANVSSVTANTMYKNYSTELQSIRCVDTDDEVMKIVQYQKNYTIAAKFINTTNLLLQTLIDNMN